MRVHLAHYQHVFEEQVLMRWPSPHFSETEAGEALREIVLHGIERPLFETDLTFNRLHLLCANEVFPESAVADPIADLEIWNEWKSGKRAFPYPGKYSRLGITTQEGKTSSKTSIGMIGEILTGLATQCFLGPWVLVRVIHRWPDFIYYTKDGRYAFVESKAFSSFQHDSSRPENIPTKTLAKCLVDAVKQLNADPFVKVWFCFTGIMNIDPFNIAVVFLELDAPNRRRESVEERIVPQAVIAGLAHRAIIHAAAEFDGYDSASLSDRPGKRKSERRIYAERQLTQLAVERIEAELIGSIPENLIVPARKEIEKEIERQTSKAYMPEPSIGRRFEAAKTLAAEGRLAQIREIGSQFLYLADLPRAVRRQMETTWVPDWSKANAPWGKIGESELWRGSSAILALGGPELRGRSVTAEFR